MRFERWAVAVCICVGILIIASPAEFYPQRIYKVRSKTSLDYGWKFYQGTPTGSGNPYDSSYTDAGWQTVNVPHSASYDDPAVPAFTGVTAGEKVRYQGICWYRKYFTVPASAQHTGKVTVEFEGAMQIASVWLNGRPLGVHYNSGYTWFQFDISNQVSLTGTNVLAVQLDNTLNDLIPPGRTDYNGDADYYLYSGLYRNVWLICTDSCSIPLWSQRISIPGTYNSASAQVHITTPVASIAPGIITVRYVIAFPSTKGIAIDSQTQAVSANGRVTFDTVITINNPALWTCKTPNLYYLYTQVFLKGVLVDDYVDRFGVRWYTWTPQAGFALNGVTDTLQGVSLHQSIGWIESALPSSRYFKEVGMVKQMGANLIRCAHFPRDPSFYNACDELGMLVMVEVPTWGCCLANGWTYPDSLFLHLDSCMRELIEVGYNHPSIIAWGLFNEPPAPYDAPQQIPSEGVIAHTLDSTRFTYLADNNLDIPELLTSDNSDIEGQNYGELYGPCATLVKRIINTEYHQGWIYWCYRGCAGNGGQMSDDLSSGGYAYQAWNDWIGLLTTSRLNTLAGACLWAFNDYWSDHSGGVNPMGVVDHMRIPKAIFYLYRNYWTGVPDSVPVPNITATHLQLDADTSILIADSCDVSIITASLRSATGLCVDNTDVGQNTDTLSVSFNVSGPGNAFGTNPYKLYAGKCAIMVKSTNTPGPITVSASATGYTGASITLQSVAADTTSLPFLTTPVLKRSIAVVALNKISIRQLQYSVIVSFANKNSTGWNVRVVNFNGDVVSCPVSVVPAGLSINTKGLATGSYLLSVSHKAAGGMTKKIFIAR
ncbi:MAG: glycoside hydrolase family 2 TIM barrel-domain containing protein [Chitinispirillaceae bacterium]|jgi:hypothetical protein